VGGVDVAKLEVLLWTRGCLMTGSEALFVVVLPISVPAKAIALS